MMIMNDVEDIKTKIMRDYLDIMKHNNKNKHLEEILNQQININIEIFQMQKAMVNEEIDDKESIVNELMNFKEEVLQCNLESLETLYRLN